MSETTPTHHPASILMNLIITLLTPMFLAAADGNPAFARQAAAKTLNAYCAETHADLITVAKIIAFGLATLAALSLSMTDDLPIPMILRLHASANTSDRSEHRNRHLLAARSARSHAAPSREPSIRTPDPVGTPQPLTTPEPVIDEAALAAAAAEMQVRTADNDARCTSAFKEPAQAISEEERRYKATWAASAATVAAETAAALPDLPPEERQSAAIWIEVLNECAKDFMDDKILPRPRPGDLAAMLHRPGS